MYTVGVSYHRPTNDDDKVGEIEFSLEKNPDGSVGKIPTEGDGSENHQKVVGEIIQVLLAHPEVEKISFTMRE